MEALDGFIGGHELEVNREFEFSANGRDASRDIGTVDGAGVPGIGSNRNRGHDTVEGGPVVGGNGDSFVEEPEEALDANSFVVAAGSWVEAKSQNGAHALEVGFERAASIHNNQTTHAYFHEDVLEEVDG